MVTKLVPKVVGHRVLIKPDMVEEEVKEGALRGFTFDVGGSTLAREKAAAQEGTIISIGPNAWLAFDDGKPWAKEGDKILFAKHAGVFLTYEDETYLLINDEDVQCILEEVEDE